MALTNMKEMAQKFVAANLETLMEIGSETGFQYASLEHLNTALEQLCVEVMIEEIREEFILTEEEAVYMAEAMRPMFRKIIANNVKMTFVFSNTKNNNVVDRESLPINKDFRADGEWKQAINSGLVFNR